MILAHNHSRVGGWIQSHGGGFYRQGSKCIGLEKNGELVAGVLYDYDNGASIYAHIAVTGRLTREYLHVIFDYPFRQLRANVIIGLVAGSNKRARKFVEHLGFSLTAEIPEGHPKGSLLIYTMRREDCCWLESTNGKAKSTCCA